MMDIGVASPKAQGHAMIRTATAAINAYEKAGLGPQMNHAPKVSRATAITTGTNHPATWSAMRWIGARLRWAAATM